MAKLHAAAEVAAGAAPDLGRSAVAGRSPVTKTRPAWHAGAVDALPRPRNPRSYRGVGWGMVY